LFGLIVNNFFWLLELGKEDCSVCQAINSSLNSGLKRTSSGVTVGVICEYLSLADYVAVANFSHCLIDFFDKYTGLIFIKQIVYNKKKIARITGYLSHTHL
jgi:hypothetical protein